MRGAVCEVLLKRPDPNNWSPGNIENEVHQLIDGAPWWKIYDIAERLYVEVGKGDFTGTQQNDYERRLNQLFREQGVGWQMENGGIVVRGPKPSCSPRATRWTQCATPAPRPRPTRSMRR